MAYTTGKNVPQVAAVLVASGVTSNGQAINLHDAVTMVGSLGHQPNNTIAVLFGILIKVTTNWNSAGAAGALFSYDVTPS